MVLCQAKSSLMNVSPKIAANAPAAINNTTEPKHDAKLPVVCSAYYVHIAGQGETCVVAENIADAMDKIEKLTEADYTFIFNRSLPCII